MALHRCCGITRRGLRCSITAASRLTDDRGHLIGSPLQSGGSYCRLHAQPFCAVPADDLVGPAIVLLLDLETTGVDVATDQIVELAAYHAASERHLGGAAFSTVVKASALDTAFHVHWIEAGEIAQGPAFGVAWARFVSSPRGTICLAGRPVVPRELSSSQAALNLTEFNEIIGFALTAQDILYPYWTENANARLTTLCFLP